MQTRMLDRLRRWGWRRRSFAIAALLAICGLAAGAGVAAASGTGHSGTSGHSAADLRAVQPQAAAAGAASASSTTSTPGSATPSGTASPSASPTPSASATPSPGPNLQSITVACPAADQVTPALNTNLISNPGAEDTTPYPASYGLPPSSSFESEPDCWTIASQGSYPGGILSSVPYSLVGWATSDPNKGSRLFFGGNGGTATTLVVPATSATQTIDLSSLNAGGQPFLLSAYIGGQVDETDVAWVTVTFENASGQDLDPNGPVQIGPVTPAMLCNRSALIPEQTTGTVPAGATQAVVSLQTQAYPIPAGDPSDNAVADSLNLTIGSAATTSSTTTGPVLSCVNYTATGPGGGLYRPSGISAAGGTVYVSNTGANVVDSVADGITTNIAGSLSAYGDHGNGGKAASASLYQPGGTAEDAAGNIYIADTGDNVVREVHAGTGIITRLAGTGAAGNAGLGGPASQAELNDPTALAVNAAGDVFVADTDSNRVDEVLRDGRIIPVAGNGRAGYSGDGGRATSAELNKPIGLALDSRGNLYIADSANNVIRRVDARTGIITTVAGDYAADKASDGLGGFSGDGGPATSAQLNDPQGVAIDGAGDLFIADTFNNAIREVTPSGVISTVVNSASAGGGIPPAGSETFGSAASSRLNTPYGVAIDPSTDVLYIADTHNNEIAAVSGLAQSGDAPGPTAPAKS